MDLRAYSAQIQELVDRAAAWTQQNPGAAPVYAWKWPRHILVAATVQAAVRHRLVELNDDARAQLAFMVDHYQERAPTVFQVRIALDLARQEATRA